MVWNLCSIYTNKSWKKCRKACYWKRKWNSISLFGFLSFFLI